MRGWSWWHMPLLLALKRRGGWISEFEASIVCTACPRTLGTTQWDCLQRKEAHAGLYRWIALSCLVQRCCCLWPGSSQGLLVPSWAELKLDALAKKEEALFFLETLWWSDPCWEITPPPPRNDRPSSGARVSVSVPKHYNLKTTWKDLFFWFNFTCTKVWKDGFTAPGL